MPAKDSEIITYLVVKLYGSGIITIIIY